MIVILGLLSVPMTQAQNTHGLLWGVIENQEFLYNVSHTWDSYSNENTSNYTTSYTIRLIINALQDIPESVESMLDIPFLDLSVEFVNGTAYDYALLPIALYSPLFLPVGNWSLLNTIYSEELNALFANFSVYNDGAEWGYTILLEDYDFGSSVEIKYSMAYGFLTYLRIVLVLSDIAATEFLMTINDSAGLYVFIGLGISIPTIIVVGIIWRRRKNQA